MNERIVGVVGQDPKTKKVIFRTEGGGLIERTVPKLKEHKKGISEKARKAINAVKPLAKEVLIKRGDYQEDQDTHFKPLEVETSPYPSDDYREKYRLACVDLMREGVSSSLAAQTILNENTKILASLTLGSVKREDYEKAVGDFAQEIVRYYPRNFWASDANPRK